MEYGKSWRFRQSNKGSTHLNQRQINSPTESGPQSNPAIIVQRAGVDPDSLTPGDIRQLQKTMGNEAVCRMFKSPASPGVISTEKNPDGAGITSAPGVAQLAKDEAARGKKHRRVTIAKAKITELSGQISPALEKHVFEGKPFDKPVDKDDPQGVHAYIGEELPASVEPVRTEGSPGKVHTIYWQYKGHPIESPKESTMFPKWMPKDHVKALIVLKLNNTSDSNVKTYVSHGQDIEVVKSGNTVYPRK